jgi:hypothetical protein
MFTIHNTLDVLDLPAYYHHVTLELLKLRTWLFYALAPMKQPHTEQAIQGRADHDDAHLFPYGHLCPNSSLMIRRISSFRVLNA